MLYMEARNDKFQNDIDTGPRMSTHMARITLLQWKPACAKEGYGEGEELNNSGTSRHEQSKWRKLAEGEVKCIIGTTIFKEEDLL